MDKQEYLEFLEVIRQERERMRGLTQEQARRRLIDEGLLGEDGKFFPNYQ